MVQAFQKLVLQWNAGQVMVVNVIDLLSRAGFDGWLRDSKQVPPPANWSADAGRSWPEVVAAHQALLGPVPAIRGLYYSVADPVTVFGLPQAAADYPGVYVVRAQRAVFQLWKVEVPWARAGQVTIANGGDLAKEAGLLAQVAGRALEPGPAPGAPPGPGQVEARVSRVVDGDTLEVVMAGRAYPVRLIGVDTPEIHERVDCYGREAAAFTAGLVPAGTVVALEKDVSETDRYGRLLRYVYLPDGRMLNEVLVREGYARVATFPPDVRYAERFLAAERQARAEGKGLWSACGVPGPTPTPAARGNCHPAYPTVCIPPPPPDLDCKDIPYRNFPVDRRYGDPHNFDGDRDGIGCEA